MRGYFVFTGFPLWLTILTCCALITFVETDAYIALGTNIGNLELNLLLAGVEIGKLDRSRITALSPFYQTSPVGVVKQPSFYNGVLRLTTELSPEELLRELLRIESEVFGRVRTTHWGPRKMDLDLLLYGSLVLNKADLIIPHPRMTERLFVLQPLYDIAADIIHPVFGQSISELLSALCSNEIITKIYPERST